jgi:apolipoprotein D and lipocalin family protein
MRSLIALGTALLLTTSVHAQDAGATTGIEIDPQAYAGVWYEIARTPVPFQQQCTGGVTATYTLRSDTEVGVENRCDLASGETESATGAADVVDGNFNTFAVEIEDSDAPGINYIVAAVGDEADGRYPWAAVHSPDGNTGWILARDPDLAEDARADAEAALAELGVDIAQLSDTTQPPQTYDPAVD